MIAYPSKILADLAAPVLPNIELSVSAWLEAAIARGDALADALPRGAGAAGRNERDGNAGIDGSGHLCPHPKSTAHRVQGRVGEALAERGIECTVGDVDRGLHLCGQIPTIRFRAVECVERCPGSVELGNRGVINLASVVILGPLC